MKIESTDLESVRSAIARLIGVVVRPEVSSLEQFCRQRLTARGLHSVDEYVALLSSHGLYGEEVNVLAEQFAVRESHFYRDPRQFAAIERHLVARWRELRRPLTVWVAACAGGEDAYTLSIMARLVGVSLEVMATDINEPLVDSAAMGRFGTWSMRHLPAEIRSRFFASTGDSHTIAEDIRGSVEFRVHNLLDPVTPRPERNGGQWDLVLCRNVLIYFDDDTVRNAVERIARSLAPAGLLFVSTAESLQGKTAALEAVPVEQGFAYAPTPASDAFPRSSGNAAATTAQLAPLGPYRAISAALERLRADQAIGLLNEKRTRKESSLCEALFLAGLLLEQQRSEDALEILNDALTLDELLPETYYLLGWAHRMRQQRDIARQNLRKAVFLDPQFWPAVYTLASILKDQHDLVGAATWYRRTLELLESGDPNRDRDHLPGVREIISYSDEVGEICRRFATRTRQGDSNG